MTITNEQLKQAFSPITKLSEQPTQTGTSVDLEKVATALVKETGEFVSSDDPMSGLDALCDRVDKIDAMLEHAVENEDGTIVVKGHDLAEEFKVDKADESDDDGDDTSSDDGSDTDEDGEETETGKNDDADDLSDDIEWDRDLSPTVPPVTRSERMTKNEIPVPARKGARKGVAKRREAREKALARRDSRGPRTLS